MNKYCNRKLLKVREIGVVFMNGFPYSIYRIPGLSAVYADVDQSSNEIQYLFDETDDEMALEAFRENIDAFYDVE